MSLITIDLEQLYRQTFGGTPARIADAPAGSKNGDPFIINGSNNIVTHASGSTLIESYLNKEIWLPTRFMELNINDYDSSELFLPYSVIKISGKKTIVKTAMAERQGTVKELYSTDDYSISLKGFLIDDQNRVWPEQDLKALKRLFELQAAVVLDNALTNIFLARDQKVVIESFDLPEVEGGRKHVRPFNIQLESDSIFTLEVV
jgi:hypothetical protein